MKIDFNKFTYLLTSKAQALYLNFIIVVGIILLLTDCGSKYDVYSNHSSASNVILIPISLDDSADLALVSNTATNLSAQVTSCLSGNNFGPRTFPAGSLVPLYNGDRSCLVKLLSFKLGTTTYSATATGATN